MAFSFDDVCLARELTSGHGMDGSFVLREVGLEDFGFGLADFGDKLGRGELADFFNGLELVEELVGGDGAEAFHVGKLGLEGAGVAAGTVEGDAEAVYFVAHALDEA